MVDTREAAEAEAVGNIFNGSAVLPAWQKMPASLVLLQNELPMLSPDPFANDFSNTVCQELGKYQIGNGNVFGMWPLIIEADLETCNGVIHVVDDVLIPKPDNGN